MARGGAEFTRSRGRRWPALLAAALLAIPAPGRGEDAPAESAAALDALFELSVSELLNLPVTTAAKREQPRWRSPNAVTVVSGETLRRYGHRTLAYALKTVVGTIPGFDGWRDHVGVRGVFGEGTFNSRLLWLIDGHRVNDGFFQGASPGETFPVDLAVVDHVEVVRGPASSLYGSNAFFGVINVVTRGPKQAAGAAMSLSAGGFLASPDPQVRASDYSAVSDRQFTATVATEVAGADLLLSVSSHLNDGRPIWVPYFSATGQGGVADRKDAFTSNKLFVDLRAGGWRLLAAASRVDMSTPDASFSSTPDSPLNRADVEGWLAELQHDWRLGEGLALASRLYLDRSVFVRDWHYQGYWPVDTQDVRSGWVGLEERVTWRSGANQLLVGAELRSLRATQREHYPSEEVAPGVPFSSRAAHDFLDYALFANDELELADRWSLTAGGRLEGNQVDGAVLTGRAALVFRPWEATVLKLQAGQGFKNTSPHAYGYHSSDLDLYQWQIKPLERERVGSVELVWTQLLEPASLEVVLYQNRARHLITYDGATDSYFNGPGLDVTGVEAELALHLASRLSGYANWSWLHTRNLDRSPLLDAPAWSVKAGAVVRLLGEDLLAAAAEAQVYGPAQFQDFAQRPGVDLRQPTYGVVNANLTGRAPALRLAWSLGVQNLLNASYGYPVAKGTRQPFPGAGRNWRASVELRY